MNCPKCGKKMIRALLPDEAFYQEVHKRVLFVCRCGYEREFRGGGKNR